MLTADELFKKLEDLRGMHEHSGHWEYRDRMRDILNGGSRGVAALLGQQSNNFSEDLPAPNLILSGLEHLAQKIGRVPDIKVDPLNDRDSSRARKKAAKLERIVHHYDKQAKLDKALPQASRWLPGYGFAVWVITTKKDSNGNEYPLAQLRDPYDCFPGYYGPDQQPKEMALIRLVPVQTIKAMYPQAKVDVDQAGQQPGYTRFKYTDAYSRSWENSLADGVELAEYYDEEGTYIFLPDMKQILDFIPNPLKSGPRFVIAKRYSFDRLQGQYDHVLGLMSTMAKINVLSVIAMEDAVFTETNIIGELESGNYKKGRNAINYLAPGSQVSKPVSNLPYQMFQQIDRIERQMRIGSNYPLTDDGISPNSFATGKGLQELMSSVDLNVKEYQLVLRDAIEELDSKRLELDQVVYGRKRKPLAGYRNGSSFAENYTPETDIDSNFVTRRVYGVMASFDEPTKIVSGLQLLQAGILDTQTLQENMDGLDNIPKINERIRSEKAEKVLFETLLAQAQQGDPKATMSVVEIYKSPDDMGEILSKFYTAEEPAMSAEEEAMLQQLGQVPQAAAPQPAAGGGVDIRSLLLGQG
jgi:hypothetical protein